MNPTLLIVHIVRFFVLLLFQGLILKQMSIGWGDVVYWNVILYPLFVLLLPVRTSTWQLLLLGFAMGLGVDLFYDSPGVHASALVFTAFVRPLVLRLMEPREGYSLSASPSQVVFGFQGFMQYSGILMLVHLFFYFSVEAFTFVYLLDILQKTFFSFLFSMAFIAMITLIFSASK